MLERIFTSKNRIMIIGSFLFEKGESYIREVSNLLKLSPSAVKKEMDNLANVGILDRSGSKFILNEKSNIVNDLKNIFIKTDYLFIPLKKTFERINLDFALIFGSFANGNFIGDSDVDILIVGEKKLSEIYTLLKPVESKIGREINPIVWNKKTLLEKKNSALVREIMKKKIIMLVGGENEFKKIVR